MAIKERLLKQLQIVRDGLNAMPPFHSRDLNTTRNALVQARDLCFQGLPENCFAEYKDTYDGLLLAIDQLVAGASDREEIVSLCSELLQYTLAQTQKEAHFKKEIFFLPYKASMWDSLESVWKAADEDKEHCIAYVMPIPYADLTPEHTVAQWHCERKLFPKNVPTIDWQTVDLEEMHPDIIFIHNAYDHCNAVTSVESRYYSSNLKKYTDKLVYIPYAVEEEVQPGNEAVEEAISNRVLQPGVLNADLVIAQSEDTRQAWINILVRHTNAKDRVYWEKRILGLGSPKIDKVLTSKREDFEMPEKWRKLIAGKKVILYNTSLGAMLRNSDKVCDKLRYVFDIFRNRDDVVLWWRPHPLMKSTFHSMRPQYEEEYCRIEKEYIEEGWGIYDDTPDLHRAICWSDEYYGDASSVLTIYRKTGKNALLQNYLSAVNDMVDVITYVAICEHHAWMIDSRTGILFQLDFKEKKILPLDYTAMGTNYSAIGVWGDNLVIAPCASNLPFLQYDLARREKKVLSIKSIETYSDVKHPHMVHECAEHNGKVYFWGWGYPFLIEFDQLTGQHIIYDDVAELVFPYIRREEFTHVFIRGIFAGDSLYLPLVGTNKIVEFNSINKTFRMYTVGKDTNHYFNLVYDGKNIWLSQRTPGRSLVRWRIGTNQVAEYGAYPEGCDFSACMNGYSGFINMVSVGNSILLFPDMANMVVEVDRDSGEMKKNAWLTSLMKEKSYYDNNGFFNRFRFLTKIGDDVYAVLNDDHTLLKINYLHQTVERFHLAIELMDFLSWEQKWNYDGNLKGKQVGLCGKHIYESALVS